MSRLALLIGCALLLAGCASEPTDVNLPSPGRSISIVSCVPPNIRIATFGLLAGKALDIVDVSDWHLDQVASNAAAKVLAPRYQIILASVDRPIVDGDAPINHVFRGEDALEDQIRSYVHPAGPVDYYVILAVGVRGEPHEDAPYIFQDIGVSKMRNIFRTLPPVAHTFLEVILADARTDKVLSITALEDYPRRARLFGIKQYMPEKPLDGFEWHDYWHEMSDAQHDLIKTTLTHLLQESVAYTLGDMKISSAQ